MLLLRWWMTGRVFQLILTLSPSPWWCKQDKMNHFVEVKSSGFRLKPSGSLQSEAFWSCEVEIHNWAFSKKKKSFFIVIVSSSLFTLQMMCCITPKSNYLWGEWQHYSIHHQLNTYDKNVKKLGWTFTPTNAPPPQLGIITERWKYGKGLLLPEDPQRTVAEGRSHLGLFCRSTHTQQQLLRVSATYWTLQL